MRGGEVRRLAGVLRMCLHVCLETPMLFLFCVLIPSLSKPWFLKTTSNFYIKLYSRNLQKPWFVLVVNGVVFYLGTPMQHPTRNYIGVSRYKGYKWLLLQVLCAHMWLIH